MDLLYYLFFQIVLVKVNQDKKIKAIVMKIFKIDIINCNQSKIMILLLDLIMYIKETYNKYKKIINK